MLIEAGTGCSLDVFPRGTTVYADKVHVLESLVGSKGASHLVPIHSRQAQRTDHKIGIELAGLFYSFGPAVRDLDLVVTEDAFKTLIRAAAAVNRSSAR